MFDLSFLVIVSCFLVLTSIFFFKRNNDLNSSVININRELKELKQMVETLEKEVEAKIRNNDRGLKELKQMVETSQKEVEAKISYYDSLISLIQKMMRDM
jgi:biopolymer transport protein ExbB/TolQ